MHRTAGHTWKSITMNFDEIDVSRPLRDFLVQNFGAFIDHGKENGVNDFSLRHCTRSDTLFDGRGSHAFSRHWR